MSLYSFANSPRCSFLLWGCAHCGDVGCAVYLNVKQPLALHFYTRLIHRSAQAHKSCYLGFTTVFDGVILMCPKTPESISALTLWPLTACKLAPNWLLSLRNRKQRCLRMAMAHCDSSWILTLVRSGQVTVSVAKILRHLKNYCRFQTWWAVLLSAACRGAHCIWNRSNESVQLP